MQLETCKGDWALITGASSGIGREFAHQLGAAGLNLVLVARRKPLLDDLATELGQRHGVRVVAISVDLSHPDAISAVGSRLHDSVAAAVGAFVRYRPEEHAPDPAAHARYADAYRRYRDVYFAMKPIFESVARAGAPG